MKSTWWCQCFLFVVFVWITNQRRYIAMTNRKYWAQFISFHSGYSHIIHFHSCCMNFQCVTQHQSNKNTVLYPTIFHLFKFDGARHLLFCSKSFEVKSLCITKAKIFFESVITVRSVEIEEKLLLKSNKSRIFRELEYSMQTHIYMQSRAEQWIDWII